MLLRCFGKEDYGTLFDVLYVKIEKALLFDCIADIGSILELDLYYAKRGVRKARNDCRIAVV
jgi:hypothetical protein